MNGINLQKGGRYYSIQKPSGPRVTASKLEVGKYYLHTNRSFLRKIIEKTETHVYYEQFNRVGYCSKQHFVTKCPNEATSEEVQFLLNKEEKYNSDLY